MSERPWWGLSIGETIYMALGLTIWHLIWGFPEGIEGWAVAIPSGIVGFLAVRALIHRPWRRNDC